MYVANRIIEVEGMNHADFGNYDPQKRDGKSSLSNEQVVEYIYNSFRKASMVAGES